MKKTIFFLLLPILTYQAIITIDSTNDYFPSISQILQTFLEDLSKGQIYFDVFASLQRVIIGFIIAGAFGIGMGMFIGYYNKLRILKIYIELLRPIPPIAWIPIAIIIFGLGNISAYFIVFIGAFFPIFTNTYFGVVSFPRIYKNVSSSFEIRKVDFFSKILFPYCLPYIFTGLKIGMGMAWMSVIAAELIGAQSGLGYFIQINRLLLQTDNILIGMMLIGLIGYSLQKTIEYLERSSIKWRKL